MPEQVMDLNRFLTLQGKKDHERLKQDHAPVRLRRREQDTLTWQCDKPFHITGFKPRNPTAVPNPFYRTDLPFTATQGADGIYRVSSGPILAHEKHERLGQYDSDFVLEGGDGADPDFFCDGR